MPLHVYKPSDDTTRILTLQWSTVNIIQFPPNDQDNTIYHRGGTAETYTLLHRDNFIYKQFRNATTQHIIDTEGLSRQVNLKLEYLLCLPIRQPSTEWQVVWPLYLVRDTAHEDQPYKGFIMSKLTNHVHLTQDVVTCAHKRKLIESLISAFYQVHCQGLAIGDVSKNNVMVDNNTKYKCILIDCDSFVVDIYGTVCKPLGQTRGFWYQNKDNMQTIPDFQNNDLFGLAAIIFFILCEQEFHLDRDNIDTEAGIEIRINGRLFPVHTNPDDCDAHTVERFNTIPEEIKSLFIYTFIHHQPASLDNWRKAITAIPETV